MPSYFQAAFWSTRCAIGKTIKPPDPFVTDQANVFQVPDETSRPFSGEGHPAPL
jgi:hypothetical protein